ncbi:MAG: double-strand break repair protein AddB, partial [Alphaproteobacteria bacterium]|nr:double-strand break repair protein AddB [Alphaproteobacteria bacterium]
MKLAFTTIYLPTRRAGRRLAELFVSRAEKGTLLPRIQPLGDLADAEADGLAAASDVEIAPQGATASTALIELLLLDILEEWTRSYPHYRIATELSSSPRQAVAMAGSVARFLSELETDGIDPERLSSLFNRDTAHHHDAMVSFLDHVRTRLPAALRDRNLVSEVAARAARLQRRAAEFPARPHSGPVIIAGSTGSIPATRALMKALLASDHGWIVLPGLDGGLDPTSWAALAEQHPQFAMRQLLAELALDRSLVEEVSPIPHAGRRFLLREAMLPPETLSRWSTSERNDERTRSAMARLELIEAADQREEAEVIGLILRHARETPGRTVGVVTPDRALARRIRIAGRRHGLAFEDSAGESLLGLPAGSLMGHVTDLAMDGFTLGAFLSLAHHPLCGAGFAGDEAWALAEYVARIIGEDLVAPGSLDDVIRTLASARPTEGEKRLALDARLFLERLAEALAPILDSTPRSRADQFAAIVATCEMLAGAVLYEGADGERLSLLLTELGRNVVSAKPADPAMLAAYLRRRIAEVSVRPPRSDPHAIPLLGLLEARLLDFDTVILAGLAEGSWPRHIDQGPWISRSMRTTLGLKLPEAEIGQMAHDFVQSIGARTAYLTWSRKAGGSPVLPSRWIGRMETCLAAQGEPMPKATDNEWLKRARSLDFRGVPRPFARPEPRPRADIQPKKISVSQVETLIRDPYQIYGRKILRLEPREVARYRPQASLKGQIFHAIVEDFLSEKSRGHVPDAHSALLRLGRKHFGRLAAMPEIAAFWWASFEAAAKWLAEREAQDDAILARTFPEVKGALTLGLGEEAFTLTCQADRIDLLVAGGARILDYKTGR